MKAFKILFFSVLILTSCSKNVEVPVFPANEAETDISFIDSDDDPQDVDTADESEDKNARLATSKNTTYYFQVQSDDGSKYVKTFRVDDYYFGANPINATNISPTNTNGAKYTKVVFKGTNYIKSKSLKPGQHSLRLVNIIDGVEYPMDIIANINVVTGEKAIIQYDLMGGYSIDPLASTWLVRFNYDAGIPKFYGFYSTGISPNPAGKTFLQYTTEYNSNTGNYMNANNGSFFDAEPEAGKSCAIRMRKPTSTDKVILYVNTEKSDGNYTRCIGKTADLTGKKGISYKFKMPKIAN
ncbi:hypothetical protein [Fibrella forsythiae]|uniref:DUF4397 domain-containing protein n=1 Tax=Fibrella forsythiae TaxID=2817061 RepID=A0ABS3JLH0_9BACT|nr:hypothetical protein [Fibrella forsythiae]MBO0950861.1 hypothetical protein [Fibrella forsythiae]